MSCASKQHDAGDTRLTRLSLSKYKGDSECYFPLREVLPVVLNHDANYDRVDVEKVYRHWIRRRQNGRAVEGRARSASAGTRTMTRITDKEKLQHRAGARYRSGCTSCSSGCCSKSSSCRAMLRALKSIFSTKSEKCGSSRTRMCFSRWNAVDDTEESGLDWAVGSKTEQFSDDQSLELGEREARIVHLQAKCEAIQAQLVAAKRKLTATTARNAKAAHPRRQHLLPARVQVDGEHVLWVIKHIVHS